MKRSRWLWAAGVAAGFAGGWWLRQRYQTDRQYTLAWLHANSRLVDTKQGPLEYAELGQGPAVLVIHGGGGGYRKGLAYAQPKTGFRFIAPSRPGFLRTPLTTGRTFAEQADAFADLLDVLDVDQAAVIGISDGGPVAFEMALRHPQRLWALVLVSAVNAPMRSIPRDLPRLERLLSYGDFPAWLLFTLPVLDWLNGPEFHRMLEQNPAKKAMYRQFAGSIFPPSKQSAGLVNDLEQLRRLRAYPLHEIETPTLVIHGDQDPMVSVQQGRHSANSIPDAALLTVEGGGHMAFISHLERTQPALFSFLAKHCPE